MNKSQVALFTLCFFLSVSIYLFLYMDVWRVGSLNINGGRDNNKLAQISEFLRIDKVNVCFLQETRTDNDNEVEWCYGADETRADPFARLLLRDVVTKQASFMHWQTGTTQTRQRVILGQAWVFDWQTISNRARQRGNPGTRAIVQSRCKQSPNSKAKG